MTIRHNIPPEVLAHMSPDELALLNDPAAEALQDRVEAAYHGLGTIARHALELKIAGQYQQMLEHSDALNAHAFALSHNELAIVTAFALADAARFARACVESGIDLSTIR